MAQKKILMVDDSKTVLMMEQMMLRNGGYDLVTAADGAEGVEKALRELPDLILLDVVMPNMDGFEACRRLREHPETKATPVIMVTTRGEPVNVEKGYEVGCTDYVTKPINGVELMAKIRTLLGD